MSKILDSVYILGVLFVAVGGFVGVWWTTREDSVGVSDWRGVSAVAAAALFIVALAVQFLFILWTGGH